jgi:Mor family transcriptional regulator
MIPPKTERNLEILHRYRSGERAIDLAMHYGISVRRVNRLIHKFESKER